MWTETSAHDAEQLAGCWGTAVAMEMLYEGAISPRDFFGLCAEAASAADS
jgi:hypothetical protein